MTPHTTRWAKFVCWLKYGHEIGGAFSTHCVHCGHVPSD